MTSVVEQLAELTGYKDREGIDVTLVVALRDLLDPREVSIYRALGPVGEQRWMTRARLLQGQPVPTADPLGTELADLPLLDAEPERLACLRLRELRENAATDGEGVVCYFPLVSEHDGDGVLELKASSRLSATDLRTVSAMLRIYHNFQDLLDYSERDSLTGLLNRKTFDQSFLKLLAGAPMGTLNGGRRAETQSATWLGVIDLDHFKRVNDGFGHLIGDEVLLLLARLMRGCFRFHDRLYRFGGEEFVALIRCDSADDASQAFERLRLACEGFAFPQVGQVTLSIGYTQLRALDTPSAAFDRADKAVYYAKHHGRNQVQGFELLVAGGALVDESASSGDVDLF